MLILRDGLVVNGDGRTPPTTASVIVDGSTIAAVEPVLYKGGVHDTVIDLRGKLVMPGGIDVHAHAVAPGPRFASATPAIPTAEVMANLRRHLIQGHTTVVDLDGFKLPAETASANSAQPVRVEASTVHFDPMWDAADACDGAGLTPEHRNMTSATMAEHGAVAIGEVGAGMTLGGGGQDYMYIPAAIERATGTRLLPRQATSLKYAVLGRHVRAEDADPEAIADLLAQYGIAEQFTVADLIALIKNSVLPSFQLAIDGIAESAKQATQLGIPSLVHNSAPSDEACRAAADVAGPLLIAGHTNHPTFTLEESIASARWAREHGAHIEVSTLDSWGRRELVPASRQLMALASERLIDIIATDYAAGHWDGVFEPVEDIVRQGLASLEQAVAMTSGNVGKAMPRIGADRGLIRSGYLADLVVADAAHPADIDMVLIDGAVQLDNSGLLAATR